MPLSEVLKDFAGAVATALACAPDDYKEYSYDNYENNKADIFDLWSKIQPGLKRDLDKAEFIDDRLRAAFAAYDKGDKDTGQRAMADIYNLQVKKLR